MTIHALFSQKETITLEVLFWNSAVFTYAREATFRTPAKASNVVAISCVDGWSCLSAVCHLLSKLSDAFHSNSQHGVNWHVSTLLTSTYRTSNIALTVYINCNHPCKSS